MKKTIIWFVSVVIVLTVGVYGYNRYQQYRFERAVEQWLEQFIEDLNAIMVENDTVCTIDSDTGNCSCILQATGAEISKTEEECLAKASGESDGNQDEKICPD